MPSDIGTKGILLQETTVRELFPFQDNSGDISKRELEDVLRTMLKMEGIPEGTIRELVRDIFKVKSQDTIIKKMLLYSGVLCSNSDSSKGILQDFYST